MKLGFGKKKQKAKAKKQRNKTKGKGNDTGGGDVEMDPVNEMEDEVDYTMHTEDKPLTAKEKQHQRMLLKKQLKVKVASLKTARSKLTKLPGAQKPATKHELKNLKQEQTKLSKNKDVKGKKSPSSKAEKTAALLTEWMETNEGNA